MAIGLFSGAAHGERAQVLKCNLAYSIRQALESTSNGDHPPEAWRLEVLALAARVGARGLYDTAMYYVAAAMQESNIADGDLPADARRTGLDELHGLLLTLDGGSERRTASTDSIYMPFLYGGA